MGLTFLVVIFVLPFIVSWDQCKKKNRDATKGLFLTALFTFFGLGWIVAICLWLGLKTRDPKTKQLY